MNLLRDVSWDALHAFAEFAEDGNFTRAAARPAPLAADAAYGRPMPELPLLQYYLFHLDKALSPAPTLLRERLLESADAWKTPNRR